MNNSHADIVTMLDELNLPLAAERLAEILNGPELGNYSSQQLLRDVIEPQYIETMNKRYMTNLRLSRLINKNAQVEDLVTSSARRYNEDVVQQLRSFRFAEDLHTAVASGRWCGVQWSQCGLSGHHESAH